MNGQGHRFSVVLTTMNAIVWFCAHLCMCQCAYVCMCICAVPLPAVFQHGIAANGSLEDNKGDCPSLLLSLCCSVLYCPCAVLYCTVLVLFSTVLSLCCSVLHAVFVLALAQFHLIFLGSGTRCCQNDGFRYRRCRLTACTLCFSVTV